MTTLNIRDVSHYDFGAGRLDVSHTPMLVAKFTQGDSYEDPTHPYWTSLGLPTAAYHWVEDAALSPIDKQVTWARAKIGDRPTMADIETQTHNGSLYWPTYADALAWCQQYKAAGGNLRAVYIPHWFWQNHWGGATLQPFADLGAFLVSSDYTAYTDGGPGWATYGGVTPTMWQYTSTPSDLNAYRGDVAALLTEWGFDEMPVSQADADLIANTFLTKVLGHSGPNVAVALQDTYTAVQAMKTEVADPAALAAAITAKLPAAFTPAQLEAALADVLAGARIVPAPPVATPTP